MGRECGRCRTYTLKTSPHEMEDFFDEVYQNSWRDRLRPPQVI